MCSSCLLQVSSPCELRLVHGPWLNELSQFKLGRLGHQALVHTSSLGMTSRLRERGWETYMMEVNRLPSYCNWLRSSSNQLCRDRTCNRAAVQKFNSPPTTRLMRLGELMCARLCKSGGGHQSTETVYAQIKLEKKPDDAIFYSCIMSTDYQIEARSIFNQLSIIRDGGAVLYVLLNGFH